MEFQDLEWIKANTELALHYDAVPPTSSHNIFCPWFCALLVCSKSRVMDPFAIMPLQINVDKAQATSNKSWYYGNWVESPLFADHNLSSPHVPIGESI